ncbi:MAG TPA: hypothetical protein VFO02_11130 [Burkholderiales bacterium]|nr:hypothetical protein [Burkholderiales bacterium]
MDGAAVSRLMSLVPERMARSQSGSHFRGDGSARMDLLCRFMHWLAPLSQITREEQQLLGVRAGGKVMADGDEAADEMEDGSLRDPGPGSQITA